jgi:hypothetical protein
MIGITIYKLCMKLIRLEPSTANIYDEVYSVSHMRLSQVNIEFQEIFLFSRIKNKNIFIMYTITYILRLFL